MHITFLNKLVKKAATYDELAIHIRIDQEERELAMWLHVRRTHIHISFKMQLHAHDSGSNYMLGLSCLHGRSWAKEVFFS